MYGIFVIFGIMIVYPNVKVNVGLNVLRKREDGFHDLETLFVPYHGISDVLEIRPSEEFSIEIIKEGGVDWDPMTDLTVRAYQLLRADYDIPPVSIRLEKRSPVGAGLGGGSSDAAFALKCMNEIFSLGLPDKILADYAARLGSDCAFFVYNRPMFGSGRGEILEEFALDGLDYGQEGAESCPYRLVVTVPQGIAVSTADAYRGIVPAVPATPLKEILARPVNTWKGNLANDFETTVFAKYPRLSEIKQELYEGGAVYASMSGSGSSLYAIYSK